ncbi:uncharacterized protein EV420DRAFT_1267886 [Desarmillaria tabescens]|uniref:Calcium uniporter protein, mitochondrial n=1 Tax=Armillaria tabescens TaxID=1929756 RepID=A0AA39T2V1_ARMTA|nr:uncharacterized protein EV420DRAFT_1267886 [Desarmillaria tabescens]KAK0460616.1 hypothetical protein EV420DRAFT_1267886 [Desarmillaria tabescens]
MFNLYSLCRVPFLRSHLVPFRAPLIPRTIRRLSAAPGSQEGIQVAHAQFLAGAPANTKWENGDVADELEGVSPGSGKRVLHQSWGLSCLQSLGKLLPTSSHLFKLIIPIPNSNKPPTVILLHPAQPLSHVSRLILSSLTESDSIPARISFQSFAAVSKRPYQWSDSTDIGDFIRDAARSAKFRICFTNDEGKETSAISVRVPTFADRTVFLRRRLAIINAQLESMHEIKRTCDKEAHRGAKRMAIGGFGMLVAYWGIVARLTFWDYGWDVMEPVTYLSGLSTVICGYLWFLYRGREVSYSSVLDSSISTRREALYKAHGLDIDRWLDLVSEKKGLVKEIGRIAEDYEGKDDEPKKEDIEEDEEDTKDHDTKSHKAS